MKIFHFLTKFLFFSNQIFWVEVQLYQETFYIIFEEVCGYWFLFQIGTVLLKCQFPVKSGIDIVLTFEE